ncbi:4422_t:CDS:2 [Dentiscutata heterogama]|uniref:4422_t:CDS:1 n=1 Tax=Dentiscutata heterogama TaxID=1316150 RepID=A0ACA9LH64_9GLOM|nr:4422_t:CDS:2 [Dentiscutata heterogama]
MEQLEVVQEIINKHFSNSLNANQVLKALKLILELVEVMIKKESKAEKIIQLSLYKSPNRRIDTSKVYFVKSKYKEACFNSNNLEVYDINKKKEKLDKAETRVKKIHTSYLKLAAYKITFNYSLLGPIQTQKNQPKRKIFCKRNIEPVKISNTSNMFAIRYDDRIEVENSEYKASTSYQKPQKVREKLQVDFGDKTSKVS